MDVFFTSVVLFGSFVCLQYRMKLFLQTVAEFKIRLGLVESNEEKI